MPKETGNAHHNIRIMKQPLSQIFKKLMSQIYYEEREPLTPFLIRHWYHYVHIRISKVFSCRNPSHNRWTHNAAAQKSKQIDIVKNLNSISRQNEWTERVTPHLEWVCMAGYKTIPSIPDGDKHCLIHFTAQLRQKLTLLLKWNDWLTDRLQY
jgi:hypothetical protein